MHSVPFKTALSGLLFSAVLCSVAIAQTPPSAQQLINQLMPTNSLKSTTRGISLVGSGGEATSGVASHAKAGTYSGPAQAVPSKPSADLVVDFALGSANLTPQAMDTLDQLGKALTSPELSVYNFKIVGHTDTTGTAPENQVLSVQRAYAVRSYLETKFGVTPARLKAIGVGEADLSVPTSADVPNLKNRRVQIINLG